MTTSQTIVRAAIFPAIGIARVGNSMDEFFIGPEVPRGVPQAQGFYRDRYGALKRQAARFRVYGYNAAGEVVAELTAENADITWTVHVANRKAAWYTFTVAMDIPQATPAPRRNSDFAGEARHQLVIDPGPRTIDGVSAQGASCQFDTGTFLGESVYLGELRTDDLGRLLFLGGRGRSGTPFPYNTLSSWGNNPGWFDDIADGPVNAEVTIDGREIPVEPAWVVSAPPNYAPDIISIVTLYDVLVDAYQRYWLSAPSRPSFTRDIFPLLERLCLAQWVNRGFHDHFGWGGPYHMLSPETLLPLRSTRPAFRERRRQVLHSFRDPADPLVNRYAWPPMYGDAAGLDTPIQYLTVTATQHSMLQAWSEGHFIDDWEEHGTFQHGLAVAPGPNELARIPLAEQPDTLTRAALTFCLGGAFHPGCELTWPMRHRALYYAPFRIRPRAANDPEPDYGDTLSPEQLFSAPNQITGGPLMSSGPGDLTRWMAVPWQTDTASCRSGYDVDGDPNLPTFWPARVPNQVLAEENYAIVMDTSQPREVRLDAFHKRHTWLRWLGTGTDYLNQINRMVHEFPQFGLVEARPGLPDDPDFPAVMFVESEPRYPQDVLENTPPDQNSLMPARDKLLKRPPRNAHD